MGTELKGYIPKHRYVIEYTMQNGQRVKTPSMTKAQADARMRSTLWMPGAKPKVKRANGS